MPLHFLVALVVSGIAGIAALLHCLGLSRPKQFGSCADAKKAWMREFPTSYIYSCTLSEARTAALLETDLGTGIVWAMGADSTARTLDGADVRAGPEGLVICLPDYAAPRINLTLSPGETDHWALTIGAAP